MQTERHICPFEKDVFSRSSNFFLPKVPLGIHPCCDVMYLHKLEHTKSFGNESFITCGIIYNELLVSNGYEFKGHFCQLRWFRDCKSSCRVV